MHEFKYMKQSIFNAYHVLSVIKLNEEEIRIIHIDKSLFCECTLRDNLNHLSCLAQ